MSKREDRPRKPQKCVCSNGRVREERRSRDGQYLYVWSQCLLCRGRGVILE